MLTLDRKIGVRRSHVDIVEIGRDLIAVKDTLPHGSFLPWIEAEFGMSERAARRFMQVADRFATKSATVADLLPTALYALASAEFDIRAEVEQMIAAGEVVTKGTIDEIKRQKEAADRANQEARQTIGSLAYDRTFSPR